MYALADIFREELDLLIPDCPHTGYVPRGEILQHPSKPCIEDDGGEHCDMEYHADDEMSELPSPSVDHGSDATKATIHEERCGVTEPLDEARSDISPFSSSSSSSSSSSYYYYPSPDFEQHPLLHGMKCLALRSLLDMVAHNPLTQAKSWAKCKNWRYQVAKATAVTKKPQGSHGGSVYIDAQPPILPEYSIFQILHDEPVGAVDKMNAVCDWRSTVPRNSFGSIPPAPLGLLDYLARRHSSLVSIAQVQQLDQDVECVIFGRPVAPPAYRAVEMKDLPVILDTEEPISECASAVSPHGGSASKVLDNTMQPLDVSATSETELQSVGAIEGVFTSKRHAIEAREVLKSLIEFRFPTVDLQTSVPDRHKSMAKQPEFTPHRIRHMISVLTAPSSDVKKLKTFWEGLK